MTCGALGLARLQPLPVTLSVERIVDGLNDYQPDVLHAYASYAALLADEQLAGRLHRSEVVVEEVLTRDLRRSASARGDPSAPRRCRTARPRALRRAGRALGALRARRADSLSPARRAVDAMVALVRADVPVAELAGAAIPEGVELAYGLGGAIGLELDEAPRVRAGGDESLADGAVVALQAFAVADGALTCVGETVVVGRDEAALL
jgi:hypothetical protein